MVDCTNVASGIILQSGYLAANQTYGYDYLFVVRARMGEGGFRFRRWLG